ncbi:Asp-tRNA(Asn)/Glu-tRNA(Gln) amidotransferase subunit GatB [Candidatus Similichlamydia epinepheli]|uniref:Asp-tRNA(Asn)/Glu-tRNA(Gln) amidotransferase subunit GatB n=1 Tax=Candidatus Similichlamydia epinepheli TaxID=1903953 RepID=UPI0013006243|nr:Asp-tRNA(Asn)/Glu-tRNA(Gln) amidotransferase subunit GatB [Candidatus Similichlamydia epinepheli]
MNDWKAVIGLEIHVQLKTKLKLFSPAPSSFNDEPNKSIHPCCTGLPGALPKLSKEPIDLAIRLGIALQSKIDSTIRFDRKSYFYPDSPRNFQITQFFHPILLGGSIDIPINGKEKTIRIRDVHLEDDTAMLKHLPGMTGIDFNRAGIALLELVTEPEIETPEEAAIFVSELKLLLEYLEISDCDMEKGHLRIDANLSVRKANEPLRQKCEIKNLNSMSILAKALRMEMDRQIQFYERHPEQNVQSPISSSTFRWDGCLKKLVLMRKKDTALDYRYFPEPDLPVYSISSELIEHIKLNMPELPTERRRRIAEKYCLHAEASRVLVTDSENFRFFEEASKTCSHFQQLANWIIVEFPGQLGLPIYQSEIKPIQVSELVNLISNKTLSGKNAKSVAARMITTGLNPSEILREDPSLGLSHNETELENLILFTLESNPNSISDYKNGKERALNFLVGKVMASYKQADPELVRQLLLERITC